MSNFIEPLITIALIALALIFNKPIGNAYPGAAPVRCAAVHAPLQPFELGQG